MSPLKLAKISATLRRSVWLVGLAEVECSLVLAGLSSLGVVDALACKELLVCSAEACLLQGKIYFSTKVTKNFH